MSAYDRWLEAPYQQAAAEGEAIESLVEAWADEEDEVTCEACGCEVEAADVSAEVTDFSPWRSGRFGGYEATIEWKCSAICRDDDGDEYVCTHVNVIKISDDNIDL